MYIYIYLEPVCPLFWGLNPPKEGPFHSKQGSFGFQVYIIFIYCIFAYLCGFYVEFPGVMTTRTHTKALQFVQFADDLPILRDMTT